MMQLHSDHGKILSWFQKNPTKTTTAIPFVTGKTVFVGYSASARMCELRNRGLLKVVGFEPGKRGQKFNIYGITKDGAETFMRMPAEEKKLTLLKKLFS